MAYSSWMAAANNIAEPEPIEPERGEFVSPAPLNRGVVRTGSAQQGPGLVGELAGIGRRAGGYVRDLATELPNTRVAMESGSRLIKKYGGSGDYKPSIYDPLNVRGLAEVSTTPMLEGSRVGEAASLPVNLLPFGRGGSIAAKAATNIAGSVGGQLAAQGADENLPQDMNPIVRGGLVLGAGVAGFEGLTNPRLGGKVAQAGKRAATGYRDLTENIPVGMSIRALKDEPTVTLYRGDAKATGPMSIGKADPTAIMGRGLYYTSSRSTARDYASVAADPDFLSGAKGHVSEIKVPSQVLDRALDVNSRLTPEAAAVMTSIADDLGVRPRWDRLFNNGRPQFEEAYRTLRPRLTDEGETRLRRALGDLGYTGIRYTHGANRNGPEYAYVFWDEQAIQRLQRGEQVKVPPRSVVKGASDEGLSPLEAARREVLDGQAKGIPLRPLKEADTEWLKAKAAAEGWTEENKGWRDVFMARMFQNTPDPYKAEPPPTPRTAIGRAIRSKIEGPEIARKGEVVTDALQKARQTPLTRAEEMAAARAEYAAKNAPMPPTPVDPLTKATRAFEEMQNDLVDKQRELTSLNEQVASAVKAVDQQTTPRARADAVAAARAIGEERTSLQSSIAFTQRGVKVKLAELRALGGGAEIKDVAPGGTTLQSRFIPGLDPSSATGAVLGAAGGYGSGDTREEKFRNMLIGAAGGAVAGNVVGRRFPALNQGVKGQGDVLGAYILPPKKGVVPGSRVVNTSTVEAVRASIPDSYVFYEESDRLAGLLKRAPDGSVIKSPSNARIQAQIGQMQALATVREIAATAPDTDSMMRDISRAAQDVSERFTHRDRQIGAGGFVKAPAFGSPERQAWVEARREAKQQRGIRPSTAPEPPFEGATLRSARVYEETLIDALDGRGILPPDLVAAAARDGYDLAGDIVVDRVPRGVVRSAQSDLAAQAERRPVDAARQQTSENARAVDARLRELGERVPAAPRPSDETLQRAALDPEAKWNAESAPAIRRARLQVAAWERGQSSQQARVERTATRAADTSARDLQRQANETVRMERLSARNIAGGEQRASRAEVRAQAVDKREAALVARAQAREDRIVGLGIPAIPEGNMKKALRLIGDIGNIPRGIMSSFDLSGSLRQAGFLGPRYRKEWKNAMGAQLKAIGSEGGARQIQDAIENGPMAQYRKGRLYQAAWDGSAPLDAREEAFMSDLAGKLPGVKQTGRGYSVMLNKYRADVFDTMVARLPEAARTPERLDAYARYVEAATGRGYIPESLSKFVPAFNAAFFSPRFLASIPQRHLAMLTKDPYLRKEVAKDLVHFYGTGLTVLGSVAAAKEAGLLGDNVTIELDPRSSDWGKVKVGDTRFDIWGGHQQFARMMTRVSLAVPGINQIVPENTKNSRGKLSDENAVAVATRFLRNKASPLLNLEEQLRTGEGGGGQPAPGATETALRLVTPLLFQEMYDSYQVGGAGAAAMTVPAGLGIGVNTFKSKPRGSGVPSFKPPTFKPPKFTP